MSTETTVPTSSRTPRRPKRAFFLLVLVLVAVSACIVTTICTRKKLKKLKSKFESELERISDSNKLSQKAQEDQWKMIYKELRALKERNDRLEQQNEGLADELVKQNRKITMLEAKNLDFAKYEKLIHGSMQKNDFALYNDIYLETFRGLLPIAESLENLSQQIAASNNPNPESLELLEKLKAAHHEHTNVLNNGQEIIIESLKSKTIETRDQDTQTDEGLKEEDIYNMANDCNGLSEKMENPTYHYQNETITPDSFSDEEESKEKSDDNVFEGVKKRVQEDLIALQGLAKEALEDAKKEMEDFVEDAKNMSEKVSEAGKAFKKKSGKFVEKSWDFAANAGKKIGDVAEKTFEKVTETMGKANEKFRKIMSSDKLVEARLNIAKKTTEVSGKIRKGIGKLFGW